MSSPTTTNATRICLIRHGETDWNVEKRLQGQIDIDLNPAGVAQAHAVRPGLQGHHFAAAYSSDLGRAWRTAQIATQDLDIAVSPAPTLRERHYGMYQGLTSQEAAQQHPDVHPLHQARDLHFDYRGGESLIVFAERVMTGLAAIAAAHPGQRVLVFTHGGVLDVVYRTAVGRSLDTPRDFPVPNAALNWLEHSAGSWCLLEWADIRHLQGALDETMQ
jgi:probable phosphoglycerate mutase